jgi:hypothetical protein
MRPSRFPDEVASGHRNTSSGLRCLGIYAAASGGGDALGLHAVDVGVGTAIWVVR